MKQWIKPQLLNLNIRYTEAGGLGGSPDNVTYVVRGRILIGSSGSPIEDERFVRVPS